MTKAQALKLARAKWGEKAYGTYRPSALTGEAHKRASADLKAYRASKPASFLTADDAREWRREEDRLMSWAISYRYRIGYLTMGGLAFAVQGQGDSWEEACRAANLLP